MTLHRSLSRTPLDLADGRVLAPGESAEADPAHPHNAALIADGRLAAVPEARPERRPRTPRSEEE